MILQKNYIHFIGIFYLNLNERYVTSMIQTIQLDVKYRIFLINQEVFATAHENGDFKLWNAESGEGLYVFNWPSIVKAVFFEQSSSKIQCFFENNNEIKEINLTKIGPIDNFTFDKNISPLKKADDFNIFSGILRIDERQFQLVFTKKGAIYELMQTDRGMQDCKKICVLPFTEVSAVCILGTAKVAIGFVDGVIRTFQISFDKPSSKFFFQIIDVYNVYENPHGDDVDQHQDSKQITQNLYSNLTNNLKIIKNKDDGLYVCITDRLQYVFIRDYGRRQVLKRIPIRGFPQALSILDEPSKQMFFIAVESGHIIYFDSEYFEAEPFCSFIGAPIYDMIYLRKKKKILVAHKEGIASYNIK